MKDSARQQFLQVTGNKTASLILEYFMVLHEGKRSRNPEEHAGSPKLWIDFTQEALAEHFLVSVDTIRRAMKCLTAKRFLSTEQYGYNRTYHYVLNLEAIKSAWEEMPLFDDVACHAGTMPASNLANCQHASLQNASIEAGKMPACYPSLPSFIPSSSSGVDADGICQNQESKTDVHTVPASPPEESDRERQDILDQCEEAGLHPETTEALLRDHTRQTIKAALAHRIVRQKRREDVPSGFIISFCRNPKRWEHGMDDHGCWVPLKTLAARKKQRLAVKARDRPELTDAEIHRRNCALAWESLTNDQQRRIREQINQQYPESPPARQFMLSQEAALQEQTHASS